MKIKSSVLHPNRVSTPSIGVLPKNRLHRKLDLDFIDSTVLNPRITFTRASSATRVNSAGLIETVASNAPRFDYDPVTLQPKGLLIEEQRTNSIRNNTMQGAVAGTPGTAPTNWAYGQLSTLSTQVVRSGVEDGINYVDVRVFGTATTTALIYFEANSTVAATNSQAWSASLYVKTVAGTQTNATNFGPTLRMSSSGGTNLGFVPGAAFTLPQSSAPLGTCRFTSSLTTNNASTAFVMPALALNATGNIDITLRIGLPQLEQGAFATSVIPTSGTAATRAADVAVITGSNFSSWYRQDEGTLFAEFQRPSVAFGATLFPRVLSVGNVGSNNDMLEILYSSPNDQFAIVTGGISQGPVILASGGTAINKIAGAYKLNDVAASMNAAIPVTDTASAIPTVSQMRIADRQDGLRPYSGHIRRIAYYPRRLSNAELQAITS